MRNQELPIQVASEVSKWTNGTILHWWESDETYFVVVADDKSLLFLRVFALGHTWHLSQDNVTALASKPVLIVEQLPSGQGVWPGWDDQE